MNTGRKKGPDRLLGEQYGVSQKLVRLRGGAARLQAMDPDCMRLLLKTAKGSWKSPKSRATRKLERVTSSETVDQQAVTERGNE